MKILLACSAGMSTSLIEKRMNDWMKENNVVGHAIAHDATTAKTLVEKYDIVLLGPQVRYLLNEFIELSSKENVLVINPADYAMAKVENIMPVVIETLKNKK